jgi:hypothetical protein
MNLPDQNASTCTSGMLLSKQKAQRGKTQIVVERLGIKLFNEEYG